VARSVATGVSLLLLVCTRAHTAELHVPRDYPTIQAAIDASVNGDHVVVAPGVYKEAIDFNYRVIIVRSTEGPGQTVIDATGRKTSAVRAVGEIGAVMEGFTITGGIGTMVNGQRVGGGAFVSSATLRLTDCVVAGNTAARGAGAYYDVGCVATIQRCVFEELSAASGSSLFCLGDTHISDTVFRNNNDGTPEDDGSVMRFDNNITLILQRCQFIDNDASSGQPIDLRGSSATVADCEFKRNTGYLGGAMAMGGSTATFINCVFVDNRAVQGGAVNLNYNGASATFTRCTFQGNRAMPLPGYPGQALGGAILGMHDSGAATFDNCVFRDNFAETSGGAIYSATGESVSITHSTFAGNRAGANGGAVRRHNGPITIIGSTFASNVADASGGAIYLSKSTAGLEDTFLCDSQPNHITVADGSTWTNLGGVVMQKHCTVPGDITGDGSVSAADLIEVILAWGACPAPPATCPADVNGSGNVDVDDLIAVILNWG
jgi:predicted outer membrane repeat protein